MDVVHKIMSIWDKGINLTNIKAFQIILNVKLA